MVLSVCYWPNGQYVISGSNDGTIRVWDLALGREVALIDGHHDGVQTLAILQDQNAIVAGDRSGQLRLWRIQGKRIIDQFNMEYLDLYAARLSPDGRYWAGLRANGQLLVRDIAMKRTDVVRTGFGKEYKSGLKERLAFFARRIAVVLCRPDLESKLCVGQPMALGPEVEDPLWQPGALFRPDGQVLATGSNQRIQLWNPHDLSLLNDWDGTDGAAIEGLRFSPQGTHLATWSQRGSLEIWDWRSGTLVETVPIPDSHPHDVEWSPQGDRIAICCTQGNVYIWNVSTSSVERLEIGDAGCKAASWLEGGSALALSLPGREDLILWLDGSRPSEAIGWDGSAQDSSVSHQPGQFLSHDWRYGVTVRDLYDLEFSSVSQDVLQGHDDRIWSLSVSGDGQQLMDIQPRWVGSPLGLTIA